MRGIGPMMLAGLMSAPCILAQSAPKQEFEVASVRLAGPEEKGFGGGPMGGPGTPDPGRVRSINQTLRAILMAAYDLGYAQISGPSWIDTEHYDITATVRPGATKEQAKQMLQNLLVERFKLTIHRETKDFPVYELVVAKNGSKLNKADETQAPTDGAPAPPPATPGPPKLGKDGFPELPPGLTVGNWFMTANGRMRMIFKSQSISDLVKTLGGRPDIMDRPIIDKTGLTGKYDFTMEFAVSEGGRQLMGLPPTPNGGPAETSATAASTEKSEPPPAFSSALEEQLGLKLESKKGPLEVLVIDRGDKTPIEN